MELKENQLHDLTGAPVPDIEGDFGKAWRCATNGYAAVAGWLIYCPEAHPVWSWYLLSAIHLRELDVPDCDPLLIYNDLATHEILLLAADCDSIEVIKDLVSGEDNGHELELLQPANYAGQFTEISDELAAARIEKTTREVCTGVLNPDTDYISMWVERFGGHMCQKWIF